MVFFFLSTFLIRKQESGIRKKGLLNMQTKPFPPTDLQWHVLVMIKIIQHLPSLTHNLLACMHIPVQTILQTNLFYTRLDGSQLLQYFTLSISFCFEIPMADISLDCLVCNKKGGPTTLWPNTSWSTPHSFPTTNSSHNTQQTSTQC